jgi:hypothetical protein
MAKITVEFDINNEQDKKAFEGFLNEDLFGWEESAKEEKKRLPLVPSDSSATATKERKHTITGLDKERSNYKITFNEFPFYWTFPCKPSGKADHDLPAKVLEWFGQEMFDEDGKLHEPIICDVTMEKVKRGKFKEQWNWTEISR